MSLKVKVAGAWVATIAVVAAIVAGGGGCAAPNCFPSASNTGIPSGTTLTIPSLDGDGNYPAETQGMVIDGLDVRAATADVNKGCIVVRATGVTIRNSRARCIVTESAMEVVGATPRLKIEDSEIICDRNPSSNQGRATGIYWQNFDALRVDIQGCENALDMVRNASLVDSYIHDLAQCKSDNPLCVEPDAHTDGIQSGDSSGLLIKHNNISVVNLPCPKGDFEPGGGLENDGRCAGTGSVNLNHAANGPSNTLIQENLLLGGSEWIYCPGNTSNWVVTGNRLSNAWAGNAPSTSNCSEEDAGNNVVHETNVVLDLD
jgi:hypothetical protein